VCDCQYRNDDDDDDFPYDSRKYNKTLTYLVLAPKILPLQVSVDSYYFISILYFSPCLFSLSLSLSFSLSFFLSFPSLGYNVWREDGFEDWKNLNVLDGMMNQETEKRCKVLEWKVEEGSYVKKDQIICKVLEEKKTRVLVSKHTGLIQVNAKAGTSIEAEATLATFIRCTHSQMVVYGMCAVCGQPAKNENIVNTTGGVEIGLSKTSAKTLQGEVEKRLHRERKLAIAIDLDHTLINCEFIQGESIRLIDDLVQGGRVVPLPGVTDHYIALRPKVRQFLVNLSNMYELYIYTHGRRHYAEAIRALLDPKGTLFADRVISRSDVSEGDEIENRDSSRTKLFHKTFKRVRLMLMLMFLSQRLSLSLSPCLPPNLSASLPHSFTHNTGTPMQRLDDRGTRR